MKPAIVALCVVFSMGASAGPGEECLASFARDLKDPESGRVIAFEGNMLSYTATNVYGARIQRKALCMKSGDKFVRDRHAEYVATLDRATEMITKFSACKDSRKSTKACAKGSDALQLNILYVGEEAYLDAVKREARMDLGF